MSGISGTARIGESVHQNEPESSGAAYDELVLRARSEPAAFGELYERHYGRILNYIYRRTMSVSAAEELTSNTFFKALRAIHRFRTDGSFTAWLYRIAGNEIRMHRRQWRRAHSDWRQELQRIRVAGSKDASASDRMQTIGEAARVRQTLLELPEKYQTAVALRYLEGLTVEQTAEVLGRNAGTVRSLVSRGLAQLRQRYRESAR